MTPEVVNSAVELLAPGGGNSAMLSFYGGEPFLAPKLLARGVSRARLVVRGRKLHINIPTNALLLDENALAFARRERAELTISIDGDAAPSERRDIAGRDATESLLQRLPSILELEPDCQLLARMTVTPTNVGRLGAHVRGLFNRGFDVSFTSRLMNWIGHLATLILGAANTVGLERGSSG